MKIENALVVVLDCKDNIHYIYDTVQLRGMRLKKVWISEEITKEQYMDFITPALLDDKNDHQ